MRPFGSRARGTARSDSDLDLLVLLFSASEVEQRRHGLVNVIAEAFRYGRQLEPMEPVHGPS